MPIGSPTLVHANRLRLHAPQTYALPMCTQRACEGSCVCHCHAHACSVPPCSGGGACRASGSRGGGASGRCRSGFARRHAGGDGAGRGERGCTTLQRAACTIRRADNVQPCNAEVGAAADEMSRRAPCICAALQGVTEVIVFACPYLLFESHGILCAARVMTIRNFKVASTIIEYLPGTRGQPADCGGRRAGLLTNAAAWTAIACRRHALRFWLRA
jgi:hypothetical protein